MAIYYLNFKSFGRAAGSSAPGAAAYRAGERIRDERTGRTYDHTERQDVMHKEILLPSQFAAAEASWAHDRSTLWNMAEAAEHRSDSRVAREYLLALPAELDHRQRLELTRGFARELIERYRFAVDMTIHAPRDFPGSDPRNFHAHLLATTREVTALGLGAKTAAEMHEIRRRRLGLETSVGEVIRTRERWAAVANLALEQARIPVRIDHRSFAAQGLERAARDVTGQVMDRAGQVMDRSAPVVDPSAPVVDREQLPRPAAEPGGGEKLSLTETRRRARESWAQLRREIAAAERTDSRHPGAEHAGVERDDELAR